MAKMFDKATVLAPGLLGASLGMAIKTREVADIVSIWARRPETRVKCEQQSWVDRVFDTPEAAVADADIVLVCPLAEAIYPLIKQCVSSLRTGVLVTDVGSAKSRVCRHAHAIMPEGTHFVGSHPMAGSEKSGLENASADLFEYRTCLVTPLLDSNPKAVETVVRFWTELGMEVATLSPENHDEIVAHISHLPHLVATALSTCLSSKNPRWRNFAGNGLRDTTRIAAGDTKMWKAIIAQNRDEILRALTAFEREVGEIKSAISNQDYFEVLNYLERGKHYRERMRPDRDELGQGVVPFPRLASPES